MWSLVRRRERHGIFTLGLLVDLVQHIEGSPVSGSGPLTARSVAPPQFVHGKDCRGGSFSLSRGQSRSTGL
jgi:hypothetical protein